MTHTYSLQGFSEDTVPCLA